MNEANKQGVKVKNYEIKINGKSTGWSGTHRDCVKVLKHLERKSIDLLSICAENTELDAYDINDYYGQKIRHISYTHQNRKTRTSRTGTYKNAQLKTIAPNNTGKTVMGFDGFVDVWTIKEVR